MSVLDISNTRLGDDGNGQHSTRGISALCDAAVVAPALNVLRLGSNMLGDEAVVPIGKLLMTSSRLQGLDLTDNHVTSRGAELLANALEEPRVSGEGHRHLETL